MTGPRFGPGSSLNLVSYRPAPWSGLHPGPNLQPSGPGLDQGAVSVLSD